MEKLKRRLPQVLVTTAATALVAMSINTTLEQGDSRLQQAWQEAIDYDRSREGSEYTKTQNEAWKEFLTNKRYELDEELREVRQDIISFQSRYLTCSRNAMAAANTEAMQQCETMWGPFRDNQDRQHQLLGEIGITRQLYETATKRP